MIETLDLEIPLEKQMEILSEVASPLVVLAELIKNGFDEKAENISISINTSENKIEVQDDGRGFTESSIKTLSQPGESYKKRYNLYNPHGKFFAGSMGIGLLSVFSIAEKIEIVSKGAEGYFIIKSDGTKFTYESVENSIAETGTKITLLNVKKSDISVLVEDINNDKLTHICVNNYLNDYDLFNLKVEVDGESYNIKSPSAEELYNKDSCNFTTKVSFSYNKEKKELTYQIDRKDSNIINSSPVSIKFDKQVDIKDILEDHFHIKEVFKKEDFVFLPNGANQVCDFEGALYIKEGRKGWKEVKKFGPAVRIYVNGFAMYNYIDREKDWLNLSLLSQNVKNSGLKPNNTIGYISFSKFNEYSEELQISKERSHFYDKSPYRSFHELIYNIIVLLTFNIDVVVRNKADWTKYFDEQFLQEYYKKLTQHDKPDVSNDHKNGRTPQNDSKLIKGNNLESIDPLKNDVDSNLNDNEITDSSKPPNIKLKEGYKEPIILNIGTNFNPDQFVISSDCDGEILKSTILYNKSNTVNVNKTGEYIVSYSVVDKNNQSASLDVRFLVVDPNKGERIGPKKGKVKVDPSFAFYFTEEEINTFSYPNGDLSRKIQQTIKEMHDLKFEGQPIATTALFRVLVELCCRKACDAFGITFSERNLGGVVKQVLNNMTYKLSEEKLVNAKFKGEKLLDSKNATEIRNFLKTLDQEELQNIQKEVGDKSIVDMLNLYIHRENEVTDDIVRYWNRMKPFQIGRAHV